ncbi:hypothetical protein GCM10011506_41330 [Marivirga lumbricoides]|uniref:DUF4848 domain-containing protein n=1 Tax=Marivirga lumbricoides TaxID=1046115 RepID=A0ABQ1N1G0_9BACT|nr:hypothetical protein GCM10011506_41330 [Marivirga lumbricoides]
MKNLFKFLLLITVLYSCNEESLYIDKDNYIKFSSYDEFLNTLNEFRQYNHDEKKEWLEKKQMNSWGLNAMEVYKNLNIESLNSLEEIKDYVSQNSNYLELIKDENGEFTLETILRDRPESYLVNDDHILLIKDRAVKIFNSGYASTDINNLHLLKEVKEETFGKNQPPEINFSIKQTRSEILNNNNRDLAYNCGQEMTDREDNGKNRTYIRIEVTAKRSYNDTPWLISSEWLIRPYKKTLGVWYYASRTITGKLRARLDFIDDGTFLPFGTWNNTEFFDCHINPGNVNSYYGSAGLISWIHPTNPLNASPSFHLGAIDFTGDTPDTAPAIISCNPQMIISGLINNCL